MVDVSESGICARHIGETLWEDQLMLHQLRVYEIFENNKAAFHDRFRDHAWRIMQTYGFKILGFWETQSMDRTEFVYLLEWPDVATMMSAWDALAADEEWAEIKKTTAAEHGQMVGDIEEKVMIATPYSPWPPA